MFNAFYLRVKNSPHYRKSAPGDFIVERALKNKPYWRTPTMSQQQKKKKLILADWTALGWSDKKITEIRTSLEQLMHEGFSLYLWQNGAIVPLQQEQLALLEYSDVRQWMTPTYPDELMQAAMTQQAIPRDEVQILDDHWLRYATNNLDENTLHFLNVSDFAKLPEKERLKVLDILRHTHPPLAYIVHDEFSIKANECLLYLRNAFPEMEIQTQYQIIDFSELNLTHLTDGEILNLAGLTLTLNELTHVKELKIDGTDVVNLSEAQAQALLRAMPNLKKLTSRTASSGSLQALIKAIETQTNHLLHLEEIELIDLNKWAQTPITAEQFQALLTHRSLLTLNGFQIEEAVFSADRFSRLKEFDIQRSTLLGNTLGTLITSPQLKKLHMEYASYRLDTLVKDSYDLEELRVNVLSNSLFNLMQQSSHLQKLTCSLANMDRGEYITFPANHFSKLIEVQLVDNLPEKQAEFIMAAPNIEQLTLQAWDASYSGHWPKIKVLTWGGRPEWGECRISFQNMTSMLKTMPNIEQLVLTNCTIMPMCALIRLSHDPRLMPFDELNGLIQGYDACIEYQGQILYFNQKEKIFTTIDNRDVHNMITRQVMWDDEAYIASDFEELSILKRGTPFNDKVELLALTPESLHSLRLLDLKNSNITAEMLKVFLNAAPNLAEIDLTDCPNLVLDDELRRRLSYIQQGPLSKARVTSDAFAGLVYQNSFDSVWNKLLPEQSRQLRRGMAGLFKYFSGHGHLSNSSSVIDANTTTQEHQYNVDRIFYPIGNAVEIPVRDYRLDVFHQAIITTNLCSMEQAFTLQKNGDLNLQPCSLIHSPIDLYHQAQQFKKEPDQSIYYGKQKLTIHSDWQALASLSAREKLTHYHVDPPMDIEIKYSARDNLYYICSRNTTTTIEIDFLLQKDDSLSPLPTDIQELVNEMQAFHAAPLDIDSSNATGIDYLRAIREQKKGACRHRVVAFKAEMQERYPDTPIRIITNDCHAFVEIFINNEWHRCDLGGYPASIHVNESNPPSFTAISTLIPTNPTLTATTLPTEELESPAADPFSTRLNDFRKLFHTWEATTTTSTSCAQYCQSCLQDSTPRRLVELPTTDDVVALRWALEHYCQSTSRPVFYIHSPEDLVCSAPFVAYDIEDSGILCKGPGGPLYNFLQAHRTGQAPVLIVNYEQFDADDIVRFNALLDREPGADGVPLPKDCRVIGLLNVNKPDVYQGSDFYSRFNRVETCPIPLAKLQDSVPIIPVHDETMVMSKGAIQLYHSLDWEERLLGRWVLDGHALHFEEGILQKAIAQGSPLIIQNGPWEDEAFQRFWQEAHSRGYIEYDGRRIELPSGCELIRHEGYDWSSLKECLQQEPLLLTAESLVLNPTQYSQFFHNHRVHEGELFHAPGMIAAAQGSVLNVHLTRELSEDDWAKLLTECKIYNVRLQVDVLPGVNLPPVLRDIIQSSRQQTESLAWETGNMAATQIIKSSDVDTTVAMINADHPDCIVIDVSECDHTDLISHIHGGLYCGCDMALVSMAPGLSDNTLPDTSLLPKDRPILIQQGEQYLLYCHKADSDARIVRLEPKLFADAPLPFPAIDEPPIPLPCHVSHKAIYQAMEQLKHPIIDHYFTPRFGFYDSKGAISSALANNQRIILKGHFSTELADGLAPVLFARQATTSSPGQLLLISDDISHLHGCSHQQHTVTIQEKKACLGDMDERCCEHLRPFLAKESLSILKTRRDFLITHPDATSSDEAWIGMRDLPKANHFLTPFDVTNSEAEAIAFNHRRREEVLKALDNAPYVFLTGLSGVGKSTFVESILCQGDDTLLIGERNLNKWMKQSGPGQHYLFLDEANLSPEQWSKFEGLFQKPPRLLVDGELHLLSNQHKVIFAGNPVSYGDERTLAPFFQRHGQAVLFTPIPFSIIYENIVKPIFQHTTVAAWETHAEATHHLFAVYQAICALSTSDVLISPRELQMIALLATSYYQIHPEQDFTQILQYFTHQVCKNLIPESQRATFFARFPEPKPLPLPPEAMHEDTSFLVTKSRQHVMQQLDNLLCLREYRKNSASNDEQRYGGLGGMVLEGAPGVGKSEVVIAALRAHGYQEIHDFSRPVTNEKPFYRLPASWSLSEKETLLLKAFHEGAVVVIDEINSSPMMERLLNSLLMGKTPEGLRPERPGFTIIGTQNPATMAGRRISSTALARRLQTINIPDYNIQEIHDILQARTLSEDIIAPLIAAYTIELQYAQQHHLQPAPTFRHLLEAADFILKGHEKTFLAAAKAPLIDESVTTPQEKEEAMMTPVMSADVRFIIERLQEKRELLKNQPRSSVKEAAKNNKQLVNIERDIALLLQKPQSNLAEIASLLRRDRNFLQIKRSSYYQEVIIPLLTDLSGSHDTQRLPEASFFSTNLAIKALKAQNDATSEESSPPIKGC
ncbi:AAA family ATPase [Legionella oakridgensis]|nr:AAA family ATPase [Legionella oakridgensis]KTD43785.1 AAA domain (dynein-related subfamily) [Legionella oakridgensis]STY15863.1 AAA domain (dynein-related subfamily) [Legionella longbeachae]